MFSSYQANKKSSSHIYSPDHFLLYKQLQERESSLPNSLQHSICVCDPAASPWMAKICSLQWAGHADTTSLWSSKGHCTLQIWTKSPSTWETAGISSGNRLRTYIFWFLSEYLGKEMYPIIVYHFTCHVPCTCLIWVCCFSMCNFLLIGSSTYSTESFLKTVHLDFCNIISFGFGVLSGLLISLSSQLPIILSILYIPLHYI